MIKLVLLLTLTGAICSLALAEDKPPVVLHVDPPAAAKLIEGGNVVVLDVRTPEEFAEGHIAGAKNIDFTENDFSEKASALEKSKSYLVHCAGGGRSSNALPILKKLGFSSIYHLDGGFNGWKEAGQPEVK